MLLPCVTAAGCAAIGEFLRRDRRIKVVTLSGNSINDEGEHSQHARLHLSGVDQQQVVDAWGQTKRTCWSAPACVAFCPVRVQPVPC